jgi:MYXO-CTERM domain-containing protein
VIPIPTSSDGVSVGSAVKQVGFGKTIPNGPSGVDTNTNRRSITAHVNQMNSVSLAYSLPNDNGGVCQGDSGGPDIFSGKVVGVHSYGDVNCQQYAASGRVTGDLAYIQGELAKPSPAKDCSLCEKIAISGKSQCALTSTCLADKDCGGFYNCFQDCAQTGSAAACRDQCLKKFPKAEGPLIASDACACDRACPTECKGNILCAGVPKCGYKFPAGACTTCTESTCCQESLDCGEDGTCYLCLKNKDKDPACATNAKRKALANCVASKCNTQCAGSGVQNGADPSATDDGGAPEDPGADPGGTTTTTTEGGCSASSSAPSSLAPIALALAALVAMRRRRDAR